MGASQIDDKEGGEWKLESLGVGRGGVVKELLLVNGGNMAPPPIFSFTVKTVDCFLSALSQLCGSVGRRYLHIS